MEEVEEVVVSRPPTAYYPPNSPSEASIQDFEKVLVKDVSLMIPDDIEGYDPEALSTPRRLISPVRYTFLNIYRRLFSLVFLANIGVFIYVLVSDRKLLALINASAANLLACGLARQPLVVNTIFVTVCSVPRWAPLFLRRICSKVYHYGGVHSGCGVASLIWYLGFIGELSRQYWSPAQGTTSIFSAAPIVLSYIILVLLLAIIVVAYPTFRAKMHDYFELTHRFSGWLVVALFVADLMVFVNEASRAEGQSFGRFLIELPAFWFLMVVVAAIIHPWLLLRKVKVTPQQLSPHAIRLHFTHTKTTFGKGIQLSKHPLKDWHGFATFPDPDSNGASFSSLISKAGDWTSATIKDQPTHLWKRGVLVYGFAYAMRVYKRVVVVTTGSGIGPCLSFLGDENRPDLRVIWQTRAPKRTYGKEVLNLVGRMDPNPVIIDTNSSGRLDMIPLIRYIAREHQAEAICVISNPRVTKKVVFELESMGIPAYGPIFDS
ncbi:integral membrane protein TmpA [Aspergillus stella-maris]|uniref:integral membrane protein TmpA n=1 Tax=Aspergillus stella-maris TaxID=1810926 RepID=UPI003CCD798F